MITDEMKVAAVKAYTEVDGKCRPAAMQKALEAALPFLPIAVEGKVKALDEAEGPFHVSRTSDGTDQWFSARDEASGVSIPGKSKENAEALVYSLNRAFGLHLRMASSSPCKDGGQEVEAVACERCQGNGEIVTDWERYKHPHEGDAGDEAVTECPDCNGEGRIDAQPASTALVERLKERGQAFANQVRLITHLLHGQAYSTTVAELNAFDAALSVQPAAAVVGEPVASPTLQTAIYRLCVIEASPNLKEGEKALLREWISELRSEEHHPAIEQLQEENVKFRKALTKIAERADDNLPMYTPGAMVHTAEEALGGKP